MKKLNRNKVISFGISVLVVSGCKSGQSGGGGANPDVAERAQGHVSRFNGYPGKIDTDNFKLIALLNSSWCSEVKAEYDRTSHEVIFLMKNGKMIKFVYEHGLDPANPHKSYLTIFKESRWRYDEDGKYLEFDDEKQSKYSPGSIEQAPVTEGSVYKKWTLSLYDQTQGKLAKYRLCGLDSALASAPHEVNGGSRIETMDNSFFASQLPWFNKEFPVPVSSLSPVDLNKIGSKEKGVSMYKVDDLKLALSFDKALSFKKANGWHESVGALYEGVKIPDTYNNWFTFEAGDVTSVVPNFWTELDISNSRYFEKRCTLGFTTAYGEGFGFLESNEIHIPQGSQVKIKSINFDVGKRRVADGYLQIISGLVVHLEANPFGLSDLRFAHLYVNDDSIRNNHRYYDIPMHELFERLKRCLDGAVEIKERSE